MTDRSLVSSVPGADNQASGRAHDDAGASSSLIIGQPGIWSAGDRILVVVHIRPRSLA